VTISLLPRSCRRGRHQFDPDTALTIADDLRNVPDGPQPDPLRDTGEIPGLADAQAVFGPSAPEWAKATPEVLARLRTALKGQHPFDGPAHTETQRVREDAPGPRIRPLPREIPMASPQVRERRAEAAGARIEKLAYPACDGSATGADYAELLRRMGRITGTTSRFEQPAMWAMPIGGAA
jgi:hypothetical protein